MNWQSVIGLEIHVQLATQSKIFSGADNKYGGDPNSKACEIDLGLPGVLPVLNKQAVRMAIKFGLALDAKINQISIFDRKNYFYPDLPKGYQISQFETPIVGAGEIRLDTENGKEIVVRITRAHLEEDAGKSVHDLYENETAIDLNRTGTPLLEIVSEPDLRSAADAANYFRKIHELVKCLKICDGDLSQGSMRCDANVSIRKSESDVLGERTEIKNINSFKYVEKAIDCEIQRQIDTLESGSRIVRETRLYDPLLNETRSMRSKEVSQDYRYFPDPDLLPLSISEVEIAEIREELPELPEAKKKRFMKELNLNAYDALALCKDIDLALYFEDVNKECDDPKKSANWVMGEVSARIKRDEREISDCPVSPKILGAIINRIRDETLSSKTAKILFESLWDSPGEPDSRIESLGLQQMGSSDDLDGLIKKVLDENPIQVLQLKNGKTKVLSFLVGQIMKETQGKANPQRVNELIKKSIVS